MNPEAADNQSQAEPKREEVAPEILEKIKNPPSIDNAMRELSPAELASNPGVVPQNIDEPVE